MYSYVVRTPNRFSWENSVLESVIKINWLKKSILGHSWNLKLLIRKSTGSILGFTIHLDQHEWIINLPNPCGSTGKAFKLKTLRQSRLLTTTQRAFFNNKFMNILIMTLSYLFGGLRCFLIYSIRCSGELKQISRNNV